MFRLNWIRRQGREWLVVAGISLLGLGKPDDATARCGYLSQQESCLRAHAAPATSSMAPVARDVRNDSNLNLHPWRAAVRIPQSTPFYRSSVGTETGIGSMERGAPAQWWEGVRESILASEYVVTGQTRTPSPGSSAGLQATNRMNGFRVRFSRDGVRLVPRHAEFGDAAMWEWDLSLAAWGRIGALQRVEPVEPRVECSRVEYQRGDLVEWYVNGPAGLEQGFTISRKPPRTGGLASSPNIHRSEEITEAPTQQDRAAGDLVLQFSVAGTVRAEIASGHQAVDFYAPNGTRAIHFAALEAVDATGRALPAQFAVTRPGTLAIVVDDSIAAYPITIDPLASSPGWTAESNQANAELGFSVSTAGDVNGDSFSDVLVGAARYDNGQNDEGRVFVYYGSASGLATAPAWTAESNQANALFGCSVAPAGDVNGDGFGDVIVGALGYDNGQVDEGRVFVWYGSASGLGPSGTPSNADWTAEGDWAGAKFGTSVSVAGDVNNDGFSDVIVGAPYLDNGQTDEGRAYVFRGSPSGLIVTPLWTAEANQNSTKFGAAVATAGDVNGDGYSDVIVGANPNGVGTAGWAYVFHGSAGGPIGPFWVGAYNQLNDYGGPVATAGDVNGDGYSDVIIGAPDYTAGHNQEGRVFVFHGSAAGLGTTPAWTTESNQNGALYGYSVGPAGDINGDGFGDVVIGAPGYTNGQSQEGRAFVYLGSATGLAATAAWAGESNQDLASYGASVATAGDVNGDGYSDVIIGAPLYSAGQPGEGRAQVYYGAPDLPNAIATWSNEGEPPYDRFGERFAPAGDVNGDGYGDFIVGAYFHSNGQTHEGRAYVYLGSANGPGIVPDWSAEANQASAWFGWAVGSAGDVNGDGYSDVIVGAPFYNAASDGGRVFVWYGSASGLGANGNPMNADWSARCDEFSADFGWAAATAGDVNGDGYSDVIIGAPATGPNNIGRVFAWYGSAGGLGADGTADNIAWAVTGDQGIGDNFGDSVAMAGDVNGDGYSDVIVGAQQAVSGRGKAYVFCGSASGLQTTRAWSARGEYSSFLGNSVCSAGDVNGDGYSDVLVGAPSYGGPADPGHALVWYGGPGGLGAGGTFANADWVGEDSQASYYGRQVASGDVNGDGYSDLIVAASGSAAASVYLGSTTGPDAVPAWIRPEAGVAAGFVGDVNGDGFIDILVGEITDTDLGMVKLYGGNGGHTRPARPGQYRVGGFGVIPIAALGQSDSETAFRIASMLNSAFGRTRLALQSEVEAYGTPFDGVGITTGSRFDTGSDGSIYVNNIIGGLTAGQLYHWRVRTRYDMVKTPWLPHGPWATVPTNGWQEADLRTLASLACPGDVNADAVVDLTDLSLLLGAYGSVVGAPGFVAGADFDANGIIDLGDLSILLGNFGIVC